MKHILIFAYLLLEDTILGLPKLLLRVTTCTWVNATMVKVEVMEGLVVRVAVGGGGGGDDDEYGSGGGGGYGYSHDKMLVV
ncbi:unnamed protein product [Prunus armeniaca]